jgi:hypothetical protein
MQVILLQFAVFIAQTLTLYNVSTLGMLLHAVVVQRVANRLQYSNTKVADIDLTRNMVLIVLVTA